MSDRNTLQGKRELRVIRSLRRPLPAYIDMVDWIKAKNRMSTGQALAILRLGAIQADSHVITDRYVPASLRPSLTVVPPSTPEG